MVFVVALNRTNFAPRWMQASVQSLAGAHSRVRAHRPTCTVRDFARVGLIFWSREAQTSYRTFPPELLRSVSFISLFFDFLPKQQQDNATYAHSPSSNAAIAFHVVTPAPS